MSGLVLRCVTSGRGRWAVPGLLAMAGVAALAGGRAEPRGDLEKSFRDLEQAFRSERWAVARKAASEFIADYEADLRNRAAFLVEVVTECDFREAYKEPILQDFFAGKVKIVNERERRVEVVYEKDKMPGPFPPTEDFVVDGKRLTYFARFSGQSSIDIEGILPDQRTIGRQPEILTCQSPAMHVRFAFTWPTRKGPGRVVGTWSQGAVFVGTEGVEEEREWDRTPGLKYSLMYGEKYDVRVTVKKDKAVATIHGIEFLSVGKPKDVFGTFSLGYFPNVRKIVVQGHLDGAWVTARYEEHAAAAREEFMSTYDVAEVLPGWLLEAAGHEES